MKPRYHEEPGEWQNMPRYDEVSLYQGFFPYILLSMEDFVIYRSSTVECKFSDGFD